MGPPTSPKGAGFWGAGASGTDCCWSCCCWAEAAVPNTRPVVKTAPSAFILKPSFTGFSSSKTALGGFRLRWSSPNGKQYRITLGNYFAIGKAACNWDSRRLPDAPTNGVCCQMVFAAVEIFLSCTRQSIRRTTPPQVARATLKPPWETCWETHCKTPGVCSLRRCFAVYLIRCGFLCWLLRCG